MFAIPVVNSFLIPYIGTMHSVSLLVVIIVGLSSGAEVDTISILCSRYFGLRSYGRNYAPLAALYSLGSGLAGALGGFLFDILGNYELMIIIVGFALALASALIFSLGRPPDLESNSKLERFPIILDHNHMS